MNKLEAYEPGESSHVPTYPPSFTPQDKDVEELPAKYVPVILDEWLVKKIIDLPESKRPKEINKVNDPMYWKYHRVVGHPMGKCFIFKEKIMTLPFEMDFPRNTLSSLGKDDKAKDAKFYLDSCELGMEKPTLSNPTNVILKEEKVQRAAIKMPKERIEKFSTKHSSSEGDMQMKMNKEHLVSCYIPFIQVPSIMPELSKRNTLAHKIKGHFDEKAFMLLGKSGYDFSNLARLVELKYDVTSEKIHGLTEKEQEEAIMTAEESQLEDSNFVLASYNIIVEEGPYFDVMDDDVQEALLQLEEGVQSTIYELKEINLDILEDPCLKFISALLTPQEERNTLSY
ncbi:hypothetical protein FXO38_30680 [Capsicum annuum]|nr:hypothetical protein FXO37_32062 [Capsicum annuum]KAF3623563.1 hypothetical protein FXO38_30680 [Capsicum annuum]